MTDVDKFLKDFKRLMEEDVALKAAMEAAYNEGEEAITDEDIKYAQDKEIEELLFTLFGGDDGPLGTELAWLRDRKHSRSAEILTRLSIKLKNIELSFTKEDIDDILTILPTLDEDGPGWYWTEDKINIQLVAACVRRLDEIRKEEMKEMEDQAMMDRAMKKRSSA